MPHFIFPETAPGGGPADDGSPSLTAPNPSSRQYDANTLKPIQLPALTAASSTAGPFAVTFTVVTESGGFSVQEDGSYSATLALNGTLASINADLQEIWFKPGEGSQNTIAYTVNIDDTGNGKSGTVGDPLQVVNSNLYTEGKRANAIITLSGSSGSITILVNGKPICAAVSYSTSISVTTTNLVNAINNFSGKPKFKATKESTNQVKIEAPQAYGSTANGFDITATATGTMSISGESKLKNGVNEVKPPAGMGDKLLDFLKDIAPTAAGALATGLILRNMGQAQVEVNVTSSDDIPDVSVLYDCQLIKVPVGYTPPMLSDDGKTWTPAVYPASWDYKTFTTTEVMCWNPALCWLALLKNKRWGTGDSIPLGELDLMRLHKQVWEAMPRCDELVKGSINADGSIFMEPRYAINTLIQNMTQKNAIEAVASVCDAQVIYSYNGVHFKADAPDQPKRVVTNKNVGAGQFQFSGGSLNTLYNFVTVQFNNPVKYYNLEAVWAADVESIAKGYGEKRTSVHAFGCASEGQAKRKARYIMLNSQSDPAMISYVAGFDHYGLIPGDIVSIVDNSSQAQHSVRSGGRLHSVISPTQFVMDRVIQAPSSGAMYLNISMPDDTVASRKVVAFNVANGRSVLTVESAFPTQPQALWVWTYTDANPIDTLYKIVSINERNVGEYEVSVISHDPSKYSNMDSI